MEGTAAEVGDADAAGDVQIKGAKENAQPMAVAQQQLSGSEALEKENIKNLYESEPTLGFLCLASEAMQPPHQPSMNGQHAQPQPQGPGVPMPPQQQAPPLPYYQQHPPPQYYQQALPQPWGQQQQYAAPPLQYPPPPQTQQYATPPQQYAPLPQQQYAPPPQ
jgi:hypothetical protein